MPIARQNSVASAARSYLLVAIMIVAISSVTTVIGLAQQVGTTRYTYDENGRLRAVIAPNGEANVYEYDAAGNITSIRRLNSNSLELLDFSPRIGGPGTQVTIIGTGFGAGVNAVSFNGAVAQIISNGSSLLVVAVPPNATTGPISVTTSLGSANTALPFTVRGISVNPSSFTLVAGQAVQFTSSSVRPEDDAIIWSVNGVDGGSPTTGLITTNGSYTAPTLQESQSTANFLVRATSTVDSSIFGQATVTVKNPYFIRWTGAPILSVRNPVTTAVTITPFSNPVSVRNPVARTITIAPFGMPVSVRNGGVVSATVTAIWPGPVVSVAIGPTITSVSPNSLSRGATTTITINGLSLTEADGIQFHSPAGTDDSNITVANLSVNPAGTQLTATITVSGGAATGRRVVVVSIGTIRSQETDTGANRIEIVQ